jgi:hypothetical protein
MGISLENDKTLDDRIFEDERIFDKNKSIRVIRFIMRYFLL